MAGEPEPLQRSRREGGKGPREAGRRARDALGGRDGQGGACRGGGDGPSARTGLCELGALIGVNLERPSSGSVA